jgi:hypothetical protein
MCGPECRISINNQTRSHLVLEKEDQPWGKYRSDGHPVQDIAPETEVKAFAAEGVGPGGCEGTVVYRFQDDANIRISIYYDIPTNPLKDNKVEVTCSSPRFAATVEGFQARGSSEYCTIKLVDGR